MKIPLTRPSIIFSTGTITIILLLLCLGSLSIGIVNATGAYELQALPPQTLGNYPNKNVKLGANTTITPDAAPANATSVCVSTSTSFKGVLIASPTTGVVRVTNAHPAGTYTVEVKAFGEGGMRSSAFTLTVQSGAPCESVEFINAADVAINSFPTSLAIGDFNEDGKQDFAVGYDSFDPLSIRLGNGAGGFTGTTTVSIDGFVRSVAVGDFNGDGHQDLAASNNGGEPTVSIRLGDGAGNFSGTTTVSVGLRPQSVAVGDFNGDGHQDLATANNIDNTVSIRFGDGAGNFSGTTEIGVGNEPISIAVGDFNGDGKHDFATANYQGTSVSIRLGDGMGGFSNAADVAVNFLPRFVAIGDFDNNNKQDIAVGHDGANVVSIRLGDGAGGFTGTTDVSTSSGPRSLAIGDFNNDGNQDFASGNVGFGALSLRFGDGAGGFTGFTATSEITVGANPTFVAAGDFNGDGKQDFAVVHFNDSNIAAIRLNNSCPSQNTDPTITAVGVSRVAGAPLINSQIATVSDEEDDEDTLIVSVNDGASATVNGVTVSNISVDSSGVVTADVVADCTASNASFTLTVTDSFDATATDTLNVTVTPDATPPTITCPENINQSTDDDLCSAVVTFTTPTANDNCPGATVVCDPPSGSTFQRGTTTVTCTATDAAGNTASCTFTVTVNDTQAPTISCPANISQSTDADQCSAVVSYSAPTVSDNCPGVGAPLCNPPSGSAFPKGTTTVNCTVNDASNNQSSCSFMVTVNDTQAPSLVCPVNQTRLLVRPADATVVVTYPQPLVSDNCPGVGFTCSPPSGAALPAGVTIVTCTATDSSGNEIACSFTVTVFSILLQDDSNSGTTIMFNSTTGDYRFCCNGTTYTGRGSMERRGSTYTLTDQRVTVKFDGATYRGTATLQPPSGGNKCTITDRDTRDNTVTCGTTGS